MRPFAFAFVYAENVPRLIVNADDFGMTRGINRAIIEAHRDGIVTSATLMANSAAFDEAVELARVGDLSVGCHVVLVDGEPISPPETISTLVTEGRFRRKLWKFAGAAVFGVIRSADVEREATAQIRKLQDAGVEVSHLDCHKHAHMFPVVLEGVVKAANATGVRAIRNPFEPGFARKVSQDAVRSGETALLKTLFAAQFQKQVQEAGLRTTDGSIGVTATGSLDAATFAEMIRALPGDATFEFVCHPGYSDSDLARAGTRLLQSRESELALLMARESRTQLNQKKVELISYRKLAAKAESKPELHNPIR